MKDFGIQITNDGDIVVRNNSLALGNILQQNIYINLMLAKGELKEYPAMGCDITSIVCDESSSGLKREIAEGLKRDGMKVYGVTITDNKLIIDASYKSK